MYIMSNQKTREAACVSRDKDVWHRHANMRIIVEMENEDLAIVMKGFVTQGGYPTGIGEGGKIYAEPFKNKFHTRLRFCRRDLIAMANSGKDDNGSQFFFTLGSTPDLQNKHTIFGNVTGETIYNMLKFEEALVDENDRSLYPSRLIKTIILNNPFANIPRIIVQEGEEAKTAGIY
ncbi:Peptidyl-prolyl cis-trans isomerase CWC27 like protein [Eufriesea mexicana]|uniref:Peptidyl-prolyl cis-trans isomerase n=1 Tax=Eufriesea mexicana TaxID=516756 RepID=A0A310S497_9HYME|nr:Peptidyl-prolyl cis-trans isomerase CWC27 like protein [Eufriesea mexicana]